MAHGRVDDGAGHVGRWGADWGRRRRCFLKVRGCGGKLLGVGGDGDGAEGVELERGEGTDVPLDVLDGEFEQLVQIGVRGEEASSDGK